MRIRLEDREHNKLTEFSAKIPYETRVILMDRRAYVLSRYAQDQRSKKWTVQVFTELVTVRLPKRKLKRR